MTKKIIPVLLIMYLLTASTIIFEISLSRLFSYMLSYHFVFIIIASALLGIAIGQIIYAKKYRQISSSPFIFFILAPVSIFLSLIVNLTLASSNLIVNSTALLISFIVFSSVPFILIGIICAHFFQKYSSNSALIYSFDLFGASSGALISYYLLNSTNLISVFVFTILLLAISLIIETLTEKKKGKSILVGSSITIILSVFLIVFNFDIKIPILNSNNKDMLRLESEKSVKVKKIDGKWNSFGKTDLIKFTYPDSSSSLVMFIDGSAGTEVVNIKKMARHKEELQQMLASTAEVFPFYFLKPFEKDSALIIGPGGGIDIAVNYFEKTRNIDAVEVNPSFVKLMMKYNKPTFKDLPNLNVYVQEGRNFVRNTKNRYDLIFLNLAVTKSGRSADFYSLTENYLFTVEALRDYLHILTGEGRLVFTLHSKEEVYKLISNYLELKKNQVNSNEDALKNLYVISNSSMPLVVIKKKPFTKSEIKARYSYYYSNKLNLLSSVSFFPYTEQMTMDITFDNGLNFKRGMFDNILYNISENKYDFQKVSRASFINLNPTTDDSPFFFNYNFGLPEKLNFLFYLSLAIVLWLLFAFIKKPESVKNGFNSFLNTRLIKPYLFPVFFLGLAYLFFQAFLFHALSLNLDNPTKSFSLLLFSFLLGNGAGSFLSNFIRTKRLQAAVLSLVIFLLIVLLSQTVFLPAIKYVSSDFILFLIVFTPSFFIGIPFPLLLQDLSVKEKNNGIAILLGVSSAASFVASILVFYIAMNLGYSFILFASAAAYLVTLSGILILMKKNKCEYVEI